LATLHLNTTTAVYNCRIQSQSASGASFIGAEYYWDSGQLATFSVNGPTGEFKWFMKSGGYFPTIYSNGVERLRISSTGNVLINTTTDAGFKLDVNGTARVSVASGTLINQFTVISSSSRLDISPYDSSTYGVILRPSLNNSGAYVPLSLWGLRIQLEGSVHISANATGGNASAQLDVTSTTKGFLPPRMTTTQKNAIATPATGLELFDSTTLTPSIYNGTNWQNILVPNSNGNVLINTTTDAGYKLDVNGTARVSGNTTIGGDLTMSGSSNFISALNAYMFFARGAGDGVRFSPINTLSSASQNAVVIMDSIFGSVSYASGTHTFNALSINTIINTGGSYNGIIRGIFYNPTLNSLTGTTHYAFHSTSGRIRFQGLPTSPTGLSAGDIWNDAGTLKIV
jgi:hypothetical protein